MNFSKAVAPEGMSSMYIEITHQPHEKLNVEEAFERSILDLRKCGILRDSDRLVTRHVLDIKFAYVIFDEHRQSHLQNLVDYLKSRDIFTADVTVTGSFRNITAEYRRNASRWARADVSPTGC